MTVEQENICKEVLKKFVYKIRKSTVCQLVFHYYDYEYSGLEKNKTYKVNSLEYFKSFNTERVKQQIKKKILSQRNDYWGLEESKLKICESFCTNNFENFSIIFNNYIDSLWKKSLAEQDREFEKEKQEVEEQDNAKLKLILKDKYELLKDVIILILNDKIEYPYKSDKIKVLLELELDVDTIFYILQTREKWISPRGYIDKYYKERQEGIKQRKIIEYELNSTIKHITNQLKNK